MRLLLLLVALVVVNGCAGTSGAKKESVETHTTPVVVKQPSISDMVTAKRQREAQQSIAKAEVHGTTKRR